MRRRVFDLCTRVYPRARRAADGDYLRDLALDLSDSGGVARQAASLVWGGLVQRHRDRRSSVRWALRAAATLLLVGSGLAYAAASGGDVRVESERYVCTSPDHGCASAEALVADRLRDGWRCHRSADGRVGLEWRCTLR